jgi:hypothetical protein
MNQTNVPTSLAAKEGYYCFLAGQSQNPFYPGTHEHFLWKLGYSIASDDSKEQDE